MAEGTLSGEVEIFPGDNGWHYVRVDEDLAEALHIEADRRWPRVCVTVGSTTWGTALLPLGNGTDFIALKKDVRAREGIALGDVIELYVRPE